MISDLLEMVHGCGNTALKFLFFAANLLICTFGALIFGFSLWANLDKDFAQNLEKLAKEIQHEDINVLAKYQASLWVLVGVGALLFLVGFLGCCGAICESRSMLTLFFVIVLVLTAIELGAAVFAVASKSQFKDALHNGFLNFSSETVFIFLRYTHKCVPLQRLLTEASQAEDKYLQNLKPIEDVFQCCGATHETRNRYIEHNLCEGQLQDKPDCFSVISHWLETTGEVVIIIAFILLIVEVFALVATCILCKAFRYESPRYYA
ncbi:unnamed protein product [Gongylonema pulchrum]|uniref:Tetraspanin n=1 Tax=Gongylonema pulchrum TaxID=637853 RepID=A0A183DPN3_9BILA|nr:unnamed protein product [Gongylonema pulchrum]